MAKVCCGFGNREIFQDIKKELESYILFAINQGCNVFYTGAMGDFDKTFCSIVRKFKGYNKDIKLYCVMPYMTKEINENHIYTSGLYYDDIIIPEEVADVHFKSAITKRNRWMVDKSDIVIGYTVRNYGGAYKALNYAKKQNKIVKMISSI